MLPEARSSGVHTNTVTPSVSTWWGIYEIEAIGPLILLENYPVPVFSVASFVDNVATLSILVNGSSSVIQGDIVIDATWSQLQRLLVFPLFDRAKINGAFPGTGGWTSEGQFLSFPWVLSFEPCGQSSDGERALEPTRFWRCSFERVGARRSTASGSARVVFSSHEHLGAIASDLGSVGECANERPMSELWCQDGNVQLR